MGSAEIDRVRSYLVAELEELGLEIDLQTSSAPDFFGDGGPVDIVNIIAWIPGTANTRAVVLIAHYDTEDTTTGANDNSAAVAALLETARALRSGPPLANDIVFLFTDAEEPAGRAGATAFASVPGLIEGLGVVANFEANGNSGASMLVEINGSQTWLVGEFAGAAPHPVAYSFVTGISEMIGDIGTDFDVFDNAGVSGFSFAYLRGSPIYHTAADNIDSLGAGSLQHHGDNALAIARHFGDMDLTSIPASGDSVFFTIRPLFVQYPASWAPWLAIVVAAMFMWAVHRAGDGLVEVVRAAGRAFLSVLAGAVAGTLVWVSLVGVRSTPGVFESYVYLAALLVVAVLVAYWVDTHGAGRGAPVRRSGRITLWIVLTLLTGLTAPGFSYLFVWPALAAVTGQMWQPGGDRQALGRFAMVSAVVLLLMTPAIDFLFLFASPRPGNLDSQMTWVVLLPLLLTVMAVSLLANVWHRSDRVAAQS
jgi:hypothetical protein